MTALLAASIGWSSLPHRAYSADGAISKEAQVGTLDGTSATCQTTLAAPGAEMLDKRLMLYAIDVSNASDVEFTDQFGNSKTIAFLATYDALILYGVSSTRWLVEKAPASATAAFTQTYATADATHGARTAAALTDNSGGTATTTLADVTEANNAGSADRVPTEDAIASLAAQCNALRVDQLDTAQFLNSLVDALQAQGIIR